MFTVIISTAMFKVEAGARRDMLSMGTTTIGGFTTAGLAQVAANSLRIDIPNCDRRAWVVQLSQ